MISYLGSGQKCSRLFTDFRECLFATSRYEFLYSFPFSYILITRYIYNLKLIFYKIVTVVLYVYFWYPLFYSFRILYCWKLLLPAHLYFSRFVSQLFATLLCSVLLNEFGNFCNLSVGLLNLSVWLNHRRVHGVWSVWWTRHLLVSVLWVYEHVSGVWDCV